MAPVRYHEGKFPPPSLDWPRLIPLIGPASAAVARYDGTLAAIPNPDVLLSPLTTQEAVLSSRIEGTQATMGEVLEFEAGATPSSEERREDIQEILNYRQAMYKAESLLEKTPLSLRVIKEIHRELLSGVRGQSREPGEFRRVPNWIGPPGCPLEEARFVPIEAHKLPEALGTWERFAHENPHDRLVQLGLLHAEFEALHPFLDGNGRIGRMLVPLFLWQWGLIRRPMFYISDYMESHREAYYEALLAVSRDGDWTGWCRFFLEALRVQAEENLGKAQGILDLYEKMKGRLPQLTHSQFAIKAVDWIFQKPIFRASDFTSSAGIPSSTARRFLGLLRKEHILKEIWPRRGQKSAILAFPELLNLAEGKEIF